MQSHNYWSSSARGGLPGIAWGVNLVFGNVGAVDRVNVIFVWPVRGGQ